MVVVRPRMRMHDVSDLYRDKICERRKRGDIEAHRPTGGEREEQTAPREGDAERDGNGDGRKRLARQMLRRRRGRHDEREHEQDSHHLDRFRHGDRE